MLGILSTFMATMIMRAALVFALTGFAVTAAHSTVLPKYSRAVLEEWQGRYPKGVRSNYIEVIFPRLGAAEQGALQDLAIEFPLTIRGAEPFGFAADSLGKSIHISIGSLKFLDDLSIAAAWLNRNGYSLESMINYLIMLRNWEQATSPPHILPTLCIPDDALADTEVDSLAQKMFATAIVFAMLHEIGHVLYQHPGYVDVDPETTRANEIDADTFALQMMARIGDPPLGVVNLFQAMSYLVDSRVDFSSDSNFEQRLALRTHPLSTRRLSRFADTLTETAQDYAGSGLSALEVTATAAQVLIVAQTLGEIERLTALIGQAIGPEDLGPMRHGDKLGDSCKAMDFVDAPFSGRLAGTITVNNVEFDLEAELYREADRVTGRSSYGIGFSRAQGRIEGDTLHYSWTQGDTQGRARLTHDNGTYHGSWGVGEADAGGGVMVLRPK